MIQVMHDVLSDYSPEELASLARRIRQWGTELGFQAVGITDTDLHEAEVWLMAWLDKGFHGEMDYMAKHGPTRARPAELVPGTTRIITVRMDYYPPETKDAWEVLKEPDAAFISRYAMGRDYHKVMRNRLQQLAERIQQEIGPFQYRAFTDSAPTMDVQLAQKSGIGWRGKHTLLLTRERGSWFFLGEIYTNLPLPIDAPIESHCGTCQACLTACPTQAIVAPYELDARRCISYLTIEHPGSIPIELRPLMGNRIYGCDDCQLVCPWNKFSQTTEEMDFHVRNHLDDVTLIELFQWSEQEFNDRMAGSAIRRIGHEKWLRNIAVALGNAPRSVAIMEALRSRIDHPSELVREHVEWAMEKQS
jgi:epoxyqueuosine reductase